MNLQPLSIFLVKKGQGGDRLLFRYPYKVAPPKKPSHNLEPVLNGGIGGKPAAASETNVQKLTAAGKHIFVHTKYM